MQDVNGARSRWEELEIGVAERINVEFEAPKITSISVHACSRKTSIDVAQIKESDASIAAVRPDFDE